MMWATVITFASIEESKRELKMIADYGMASVKRAWNKSKSSPLWNSSGPISLSVLSTDTQNMYP
jgi:hypothetical protein